MFNFFGGPSEDDLKQINKGLKAENKAILAENKSLKAKLEAQAEAQSEYEKKQSKRSDTYFREQDEEFLLNEKHRDRDLRESIEEAEDAADRRVKAIEKAADERVRAAELKVGNTDVAVRTAVLKEKESTLNVTSGLEVEVAAETARADAAETRCTDLSDDLESTMDLMKEFAKTNTAFADQVLKKLPNVDLTKMSVNIEMPAPEVTVVNGQKGEQKK